MSLLVSSFNSNNLLEYVEGTGTFKGEFVTAGLGGLTQPRGLAFDADSKLYVSSFGTNNVLRYNADGTFDQVFATGNGLNGPSGIRFDSDGKLYICSTNGNNVLRFNADGTFDRIFASNANLTNPQDLLFLDGKVYVSGQGSNNVVRFNTDGTFDVVFTSTHAVGARGLAVDLAVPANLLVCTELNTINAYEVPGGAFKELRATAGALSNPYGIALNGQDIYVACGRASTAPASNSSVLRYDQATGEFRGVFASGGGLNYPTYLIFRPEGGIS